MDFYDLGFSLVRNLLIIVIPNLRQPGRNLLLPAEQQISRAVLLRFGMTILKRIHTVPLPGATSLAAFNGGL